jgi:hypothetical protein
MTNSGCADYTGGYCVCGGQPRWQLCAMIPKSQKKGKETPNKVRFSQKKKKKNTQWGEGLFFTQSNEQGWTKPATN